MFTAITRCFINKGPFSLGGEPVSSKQRLIFWEIWTWTLKARLHDLCLSTMLYDIIGLKSFRHPRETG